jgi:hypothetical protein
MTEGRPKGAVAGPLLLEGMITPPFPKWRVLMKLTWDRASPEVVIETTYEETGEVQHRTFPIPAGKDPDLVLRKELMAETQRWVGVFPDAKLSYFDVRIARKIIQKGAAPSVAKTQYARSYAGDRRPLDVATANVKARVERAMVAQPTSPERFAQVAGVAPVHVARLLSGRRIPLAELWAIDKAARAQRADLTPLPGAAKPLR